MKKLILRLCLFVALLALAIYLNRSGFLQKTLDVVEGYGAWSPLVFLLIYIATCVFFIPSFVFTFSSGILFGFWQGLGLSLLGGGVGSVIAFCIGRYLAHDWIEKKFLKNEKFQKISKALSVRGWKILILARLTPFFPFLFGNYAFGTTRIPALHYFAAAILGTIPSASVYAYLGVITGDLAAWSNPDRARSGLEWALLGVGLLAVIGLSVYLKKFADKVLKDELN